MYPLHLFESKGHLELYIGSGIGVVCQLFVVVEAIFAVAKSERPVPTHTEIFPVIEVEDGGAKRPEEDLHLAVLRLAGAARDDVIRTQIPHLTLLYRLFTSRPPGSWVSLQRGVTNFAWQVLMSQTTTAPVVVDEFKEVDFVPQRFAEIMSDFRAAYNSGCMMRAGVRIGQAGASS